MLVAGATVLGVLMLFSYDVIKIDWISFMEIQPSYKPMENPRPVPDRSIPIEGPVSIPNMGAPSNPVPADEASIARGAELFSINCQPCHGADGKGNGPVAAFLQQRKPTDLTGPVISVAERWRDLPDHQQWEAAVHGADEREPDGARALGRGELHPNAPGEIGRATWMIFARSLMAS